LTDQYERWISTPEGLYFDEKLKELLISSLRLKTGQKVLEVGAGTGRYVRYLSELGINATGVEPMEELLKLATYKSGIEEGQIVKAFAESLPFGDDTFDSVMFMTTFEYTDDKTKALREAFRVSKSRIAIGFLNKFGVTNLFRAMTKQGLYSDAKFFSSGELKKLVEIVFLDKLDEIDISVRHSIYLPLRLAHFFPWLDDMLEEFNLPFGNFAVLVIKKKIRKKVF
jgi:ubiquinone/menaquinone biosynthesis C-methylase UbiE